MCIAMAKRFIIISRSLDLRWKLAEAKAKSSLRLKAAALKCSLMEKTFFRWHNSHAESLIKAKLCIIGRNKCFCHAPGRLARKTLQSLIKQDANRSVKRRASRRRETHKSSSNSDSRPEEGVLIKQKLCWWKIVIALGLCSAVSDFICMI
jgi:hypothetical protein